MLSTIYVQQEVIAFQLMP